VGLSAIKGNTTSIPSRGRYKYSSFKIVETMPLMEEGIILFKKPISVIDPNSFSSTRLLVEKTSQGIMRFLSHARVSFPYQGKSMSINLVYFVQIPNMYCICNLSFCILYFICHPPHCKYLISDSVEDDLSLSNE